MLGTWPRKPSFSGIHPITAGGNTRPDAYESEGSIKNIDKARDEGRRIPSREAQSPLQLLHVLEQPQSRQKVCIRHQMNKIGTRCMICSRKDVDTRPVKYNFRTSASQQGLEKSGKIGKRLHPLVPPIPRVDSSSKLV